MWWNRKTTRKRRIESRKRVPSAGPSAWRKFRETGGLGAALLASLLLIVAVLMDAWPTDPLPYRPGEYIPADIHARLDFEVPSQQLLNEQIESVKNTTPSTFQLNVQLVEEIMAKLAALPAELVATSQPAADGEPPDEVAPAAGPPLEGPAAYTQPARQQEYAEHLKLLRAELTQLPLVRPDDVNRSADSFHMVYPGGRETRHVSKLISLASDSTVERLADRLAATMPPSLRSYVRGYLLEVFRANNPLYRYNAAATQQELQARLDKVLADPPKVAYAAGQLLVRQSRRQTPGGTKVVGLAASELELLRAEHEAYLAAQIEANRYIPALRLAGRTIAVALILALLYGYIWRQHERIIADHWRAFALTALLAAVLAAAKLTAIWPELNPHAVILPVLIAVVTVTIAYEQRLAFVIGAILSLLVVLQLRAGLSLLVVLLSGMMAEVFLLGEIRRRSRLIEVSVAAAGLAFAAVWAAGLASATPWRFTLADGVWAAGSAVFVGFVVQGGLPVIERVFGVATSLTLLEWCDASRPLLKRLAVDAPGTYNHSLQLGTMCEAAADAIGARGLLARVGAYYHDIGKINKPDYFAENQTSPTSKHAKLSPAMSLLIIIGHVKDGLEMARQYGLPAILHEFITSHHGTTLLQYFYEAASEQRKAADQRPPEEVEFRYPGPKPHSKECAILMLADAAESSVRSMSEPTPGRIENQVHTMVTRRLMDGQLDECELTLTEVHSIETSLIKSLCGIYHSRVSYPTPKGDKPSAAELLAAKEAAEREAPEAETSQPESPPKTAEES